MTDFGLSVQKFFENTEGLWIKAESLEEMELKTIEVEKDGWEPFGDAEKTDKGYRRHFLRKVEPYKILEASSIVDLQKMVNEAIHKNFKPVGGIAVSDQSSPAVMNKDILVPRFVYLQAVVKKEY